jgi:hypothetical protein
VAVPLGLALLRQRGLAAWLAISMDLLRRDATPVAPPALRADAAPIPAGVDAALVRTLATMALAACEEKGAS